MYATIDTVSRERESLRSGHPPPLLISKSRRGRVETDGPLHRRLR
ncbi:MAG: hypothetical protein KF705_14035 [Phycisphaeraceae bacterium]|nr:hypothetical protein [Phycisphaeraceae bacterium]